MKNIIHNDNTENNGYHDIMNGNIIHNIMKIHRLYSAVIWNIII